MAFFVSAEDLYSQMTLNMTDLDTSENSFIYNALYPTCLEISYGLLCLDEMSKMVFASTATENNYSEYLDKRVEEMGITRKKATTAELEVTIRGKIGTTLKINSIVSTTDNRLYYTQSELTLEDDGKGSGIGKVIVKADKSGASYNVKAGEINYLPVKYTGISSVTNEEDYTDAYDEETDDDLYNRYMIKAKTPATSGNKYHYEQWALEVTGVGSAKCISGAGNVKVIIANSNKRKASEELIKKVYNYIDTERPVLAGTLTVATVTETNINITANVEIDKSVVLGNVQEEFKKNIEDYFTNTVYTSKKISIAKLGALLMDIEGVVDYSNLKINGGSSNVTLGEDEIAVVGTVTLGVIS